MVVCTTPSLLKATSRKLCKTGGAQCSSTCSVCVCGTRRHSFAQQYHLIYYSDSRNTSTMAWPRSRPGHETDPENRTDSQLCSFAPGANGSPNDFLQNSWDGMRQFFVRTRLSHSQVSMRSNPRIGEPRLLEIGGDQTERTMKLFVLLTRLIAADNLTGTLNG